jgi:hypothetical protein
MADTHGPVADWRAQARGRNDSKSPACGAEKGFANQSFGATDATLHTSTNMILGADSFGGPVYPFTRPSLSSKWKTLQVAVHLQSSISTAYTLTLLPEAYRGVAFSRGACPKHPANLTKTRLSSKHTVPRLHARYGPPASVWWTLFVTMFFTLLFGFPINKAFESIASWFFPQHSARSIISLTYVYPLMALAFIWYGLMECIASYWARERYHVARPKYFT